MERQVVPISELQTTVIDAEKNRTRYLRDIWHYRGLFYFLAWRDIMVRYKQTFLGIAWSVIRPLLTMLVFTVIFGRIAKLPSDGIPYPLLVFSAMLPWQFFANALAESSNSLVGNANLISKVYFPRLIVPTSSVIVSLVDFGISFVLMMLLMAWYGVVPDWRVLLLPLFILLAFAAALGAGLGLAALTVKYRDFRFIVPFIIQLGLYASPVGYLSNLIPAEWRLLYFVNPMAGVIDGFRWALLGGSHHLYLPGVALSVFSVFVLLVTGITYFRRTEQTFADVI